MTVKKAHDTPAVRERLAERLEALSKECEALAHDREAPVEAYERVLLDIETLAAVMREWNVARREAPRATEWTLEDAGQDATLARTIERASGSRLKAATADDSGWCSKLTREDANRVIEELRAEDAVRNDVQRALA